MRVELARSAGGEHHGVGRDLLAAALDGGGLGGGRPVADEQVDAADASVPEHEIHQERVLDDAHAAGPQPRDERLLDRGARGIPSRVQDARIRVRRLQSLDERAFGIAVERDAEVDEFADARGSLFGEHAHGGGVVEARPRGERVADVVGDPVVVEHDAGDAALRVAGVGVLEHVLRHERDAAAVLDRVQRDREAGDARSDDDDLDAIRSLSFVSLARSA